MLLALDDALEGHGGLIALSGESGVGKSRLLEQLALEAKTRGARVLSGRGYSLEGDRPYGPWTDALTPIVEELGSSLTVVARGLERDLAAIVPAIGAPRGDAEDKGHLFWNVGQFLARLGRRKPLVLILEDLHFADASTVELVHFVGRHLESVPVLVVVSWVTGAADAAPLEMLATSLAGRSKRRQLAALTPPDLTELLQRAFAVEGDVARAFAAALHARTGGNAFFVEELLKEMIRAGHLGMTDGAWVGFEHGVPDTLPASVAEAVEHRLSTFGADTRRLVEVVALAGTAATLPLLEGVAALDANALGKALDELVARLFLTAPASIDGAYSFPHYLVHAAVVRGISEARARAIHRAIAEHLMRQHAVPGADLARHLSRAGMADEPGAFRPLLAAGRDALLRRANGEAVRWLRDAERNLQLHRDQLSLRPGEEQRLLADLARAEWRLGALDASQASQQRALALAAAHGDAEGRARILLQAATAAGVGGRATEALAAANEAMDAAATAGAWRLEVAARVAAALALQSLGRMEEGKGLVEAVTERVAREGDPAIVAVAHRALVLLYGWTGPGETARRHADIALQAARASGDDDIAWSVHWALAVLEGFTGNGEAVRHHRDAAWRLAESLGSPSRAARSAEVAIEYASATGAWGEARAWAERAIPIARAVAPRTLLPRLLVWAGLVYLAQEEREEARAMLDEAWDLSGAGLPGTVPVSAVQNVVLAHTGRAAWHLASGDWHEARRLGEAGLVLADRYGLVAWGIHRLLPQIAEASIWQQDFDRALEVAARLRRDGTPLQHKLALAWATAIEALVARLRDGRPDAAERLIEAAEQLEAVPFVFHAARVRRNAAQILAADGRTDEAVRELRRAHQVFLRSGAVAELRGTRSALRSLGVRLPPQSVSEGAGALTGREVDIARCVAEHLTNKEIGLRLDISARTVSTHLANIFRKVGVESRAELADLVRSDPRFAP